MTMPHTEEQWSALLAAGDVVDAKLQAGDVRLTMGGEPTFVAATDRDADEWNTGAVGPTKRLYGDRLIRRLRDRFAPGGLLQYGQGKWYPGEQLPRWAFALLWRRDGQPMWDDASLIASEAAPGQAGPAEAAAFAETLAEMLDLDPSFAQPAFEDPAEFLLRERKLAPNLDPLDNKLDDPEERQRLSRVFDRGLETPSSFVLPIQAAQARDHSRPRRGRRPRRFRWASEQWRTRRGRLFLIPGDSPAGFRLPLRSLSYIDPLNYPHVVEMDPFAPRGALPQRTPSFQARYPATGRMLDPSVAAAAYGAIDDQGAPAPLQQPVGPAVARGRSPITQPLPDYRLDAVELQPMYEEVPWLPMEDVVPGMPLAPGLFYGPSISIRTAMTIEPRNGVLNVFMPPTHSTDEYVDLIAAIEDAAEATGLPVHIEGYPPPSDPRLNVIKVTPDPGVLEINIHPAATWREQVEITETLYEEARLCGLDSSKFMVDGRPTGSGGGAHVVVGGAAPADSPFLRRPDLLGSLIRYWQNHPSLSYLFSGMFIGPTSQAPRIDEARHDSLYELEIALNQIPDPTRGSGQESPPWLIDRILRHLLTDVTGNTHRAEICIDKLYSPDGPTGRLGLVEFRAFEMPPHARMNLAQMLVLRALIARFWDTPYTQPFIRYGTHLHDRFMLPHYIWEDFKEVLAETSDALGVAFDPAWFNSQFEFRFPRYGAVGHRGVEMELRAGIEPWHVLGEEGSIGGVARFVDSSVERLQVRLTGDLSDRYVATVNGWRLPLQRTDRADEQVAGLRYRTWLPASALHPTIPPHGPLIFDLVDTWNGRSIGGCTYHVVHQGGRNYETQPVNALEAESRRKTRFQDIGHTPGPFTIFEPALSPEAPSTLDLRMQHRR
ncbi:MAG: transglutaminase family protein [Pseudomonadota bacterium]